MDKKVAILGASEKPHRFSYKAYQMLKDYGYETVLISPRVKEIEKTPVLASLREISGPIDTLTMYVGPDISSRLTADILQLHPKKVIFNPGSENKELQMTLEKAGIRVFEACTLVLLGANEFENL